MPTRRPTTLKNLSPLAQRCYARLRDVPAGRLTTYRDLAHAVGTRAYRAIGQILHRNPYAPEVPCHRVISADGSLGGFAGGVLKKARLLRAEGVPVRSGRVVGYTQLLHRFRSN